METVLQDVEVVSGGGLLPQGARGRLLLLAGRLSFVEPRLFGLWARPTEIPLLGARAAMEGDRLVLSVTGPTGAVTLSWRAIRTSAEEARRAGEGFLERLGALLPPHDSTRVTTPASMQQTGTAAPRAEAVSTGPDDDGDASREAEDADAEDEDADAEDADGEDGDGEDGDEDDDEGTNEPIPFGDPPDIESYGDIIRVSSDPAVLARLRDAAGPPPDPLDLLRKTREHVADGFGCPCDGEVPPSLDRHAPDGAAFRSLLLRTLESSDPLERAAAACLLHVGFGEAHAEVLESACFGADDTPSEPILEVMRGLGAPPSPALVARLARCPELWEDCELQAWIATAEAGRDVLLDRIRSADDEAAADLACTLASVKAPAELLDIVEQRLASASRETLSAYIDALTKLAADAESEGVRARARTLLVGYLTLERPHRWYNMHSVLAKVDEEDPFMQAARAGTADVREVAASILEERKLVSEHRARVQVHLEGALDLLIRHGLLSHRPGPEQMDRMYRFVDERLELWDLLPAFDEADCAFSFDSECNVEIDEVMGVDVVRHDVLLIDEFQKHSGGVFQPTHVSQSIRDWTVYVRFVHDGRAYEARMADYTIEADFCDWGTLAEVANCALWKSGRPERFVMVPSKDQGANLLFTAHIEALRALASSGLVKTFWLDGQHFLAPS